MTIYNMTLSTTEPYNNVGAITVRQDDNLTQTFVAKIVENGKPKTELSGYQVFFNALFGGNIIARDLAEFNYGTSTATYTLKDSFFQQTGEVEAYFSFEKDGKRDSTANFSYYVTQGNCRNIRQGNYIYELEELMAVSDDIIKNKDFTVLLEENKKLNAKLEEVMSGFAEQLTNVNDRLTKHKDRTDNEIKKKVVKKKRIYNNDDSGTFFLNNEFYQYALSSNQEFKYVKVVFARHDPDNPDGDKDKYYGYINTVFDQEDFRTGPNYAILSTHYNKLVTKQIYVTSEGLRGHNENKDGDAAWFILKRITVYYTEK